jgi:hypothetical protein
MSEYRTRAETLCIVCNDKPVDKSHPNSMGVTCNTPKCVHYLHSAESFGAETITTTKIDNNGGEWTLQYRQPPIGEQPTEIVATTPTWSHEKNDFSNVFTIYLNRVPDSTSIMPSRQSPTGYWWIASRPAWGEKNIRFTNYDSLWNWIGSDEIYDFPYFAESFGAEEEEEDWMYHVYVVDDASFGDMYIVDNARDFGTQEEAIKAAHEVSKDERGKGKTVYVVAEERDMDIEEVIYTIDEEGDVLNAESLMAINQNTPISNFTTNELTHSSTVQGDFNQASINSSGHQNFEVRGAEEPIDAQENLRLTILSFIDDSWDEEDEEAWRRHLNTYDTDRKKAQVLDKIMARHDRMQLQSDGIAYELDRMEWMLENPDKDYDDYAESFGAESLEDLDKSQLIDLIKNLEDRDEYVKGYVENAAESFGAESQKLGIIYRIDRDDKTADILGVLSSYAEGKKAMTYMFKSALEEYSEDQEESLMSFTEGKKEFEWYESRSKKKKHLDFYHPTGYEDIIIVLQEFRIETLMDFYDMINEDKFSAETFNAESFSAERNRVCNICNEIKPTRAYKFPTYKGMYEPVQVMIRDYCDSCAHADGLSAESFEAEKLHPALYRYKGKIKLRKGWTECQACDDLVKMNDINFAYLEGYGNATVCDACVEKNQGYKRMENYMRDKWTSWKDWGEKKEYSKKIVPVRKKSKWGESEIYRLKHDGIIKGAEGMNTVRCNKCMWEGEEEDLVMFEDEDGFGKGCPKCETDAYLMDLEAESFGAEEPVEWDELIGEQCQNCKEGPMYEIVKVVEYDWGVEKHYADKCKSCDYQTIWNAESFAAEYGKRQRFGKRYVARDTKGKFISNVSVGRSLKADRRTKSKTPARSGFGHKGDSQKGASSEFKMPTDAKSLIGIGAVLGGLLAYLESKA